MSERITKQVPLYLVFKKYGVDQMVPINKPYKTWGHAARLVKRLRQKYGEELRYARWHIWGPAIVWFPSDQWGNARLIDKAGHPLRFEKM